VHRRLRADDITRLPPLKLDRAIDWYPDALARAGVEGKLLVGFNVTARGPIANLAVIDVADHCLADATLRLLKSAHFEESPGELRREFLRERHHFGLVLCIPPSAMDESYAVPAQSVVIKNCHFPGRADPAPAGPACRRPVRAQLAFSPLRRP
jgi:hypothetical protein